MGEAPSFGVDDLHTSSGNGFHLNFKGTETTIVVGERKYVIGGSDKDSALCIGVEVFDQSTGLWENPTILGSKPTPSRDYHAMLIDQDRILIVKNDSTPNDCLWFLEVDTEFVRQQRKKIGRGVVVAWSKGVIGYAGKPIVISGPSGVGKGTLISKLMTEYPCMFGFSVSHTTRAPREKEKDGIHYHFMDHSVMEKEINDGKFLEFASVHGNLYGTSVEAVEVVADAGKRCILDIDVQGAKSVRASSLEAIFIFIAPPSFEDLERRLRGRGTETEEQIQKRLRNALGELEQGRTPGLFDHMLVNDDLETCYESLKKLLGLCEAADTKRLSERKTFDLLLVRSASKVDGKIHIECATLLDAENSRDSFVVDVSCIKGGAPGRTRGLDLRPIKKNVFFRDCQFDTKQLS